MKLIFTFSIVILSTISLLAQNKKADSTSTTPSMKWEYHHEGDPSNSTQMNIMERPNHPKNILQPGHKVPFPKNTDLFDVPLSSIENKIK